jgi:hypothetical protein
MYTHVASFFRICNVFLLVQNKWCDKAAWCILAMRVDMGKCIVCFKEEKIMLLITHTIMLRRLYLHQQIIYHMVLWSSTRIVYHTVQCSLIGVVYHTVSCYPTEILCHTLSHSPTGIVCHIEHSVPSFNERASAQSSKCCNSDDPLSCLNAIHHFKIYVVFNAVKHSCN